MNCATCFSDKKPLYLFSDIKISGVHCTEYDKIIGKPICENCKNQIMERLNYHFRYAYLCVHVTKLDS